METIIIKLDSRKLKNPDLDIRYLLPEAVEKLTKEKVYDNGYDYLNNHEIAIWLAADSAKGRYAEVIELMKKKKFCGNNLSETAEVYISEQENAELESCEKVYPQGDKDTVK